MQSSKFVHDSSSLYMNNHEMYWIEKTFMTRFSRSHLPKHFMTLDLKGDMKH